MSAESSERVPSHPDMRVIDAHQHYGRLDNSLGSLGGQSVTLSEDEFAEREISHRLSLLDAHGIDGAIVLAGHAYVRPDGLADTRRVNDELVSYCRSHSDRLLAAVGVAEPLYGQKGLAEIDRCADELGMRALTFHTRFQGVSIDSPWVCRYVERLGELGMFAYVHALADSTEESLWKIDQLARSVPDVPILVVSSFSDFEQPRLAVDIAERRSNTYWDTAVAYSFELVMPLLRAIGADRVIYGSDMYSWPIRIWSDHVLREIRATSELSDTQKRSILSGNIARLLHLDSNLDE